MSQSPPACPKCEQAMEEGFFAEERTSIASWYEGPPRRLLGMPLVQWSKRRLKITAYRCKACGYLESYAR